MKLITQTPYKCDICGLVSQWNTYWSSIIFPFGKGYAGWEHEFHVCSSVCEDKLRALSSKEAQEAAERIILEQTRR